MKSFKKLVLSIAIFLSLCSIGFLDVKAETLIKKGKASHWTDLDIGHQVEFKIKEAGILYFEFDMMLESDFISDGKQGIMFTLTGYENKDAYLDDFMMDKSIYQNHQKVFISKGYNSEGRWIRIDDAPAGYYIMELEQLDDNSYVNYSIKKYKNFASSITIPKSLQVTTDSWKKIKISNILPKGAIVGNPDKNVSVDKKNIATIWDDGRNAVEIYGKKAGKCTLTIKLNNGKKYKCKITVKDPPAKLNHNSCSLYKGDTTSIKLLYTKKKVKWYSSNSRVAVVNSNGKVTAKNNGKCTITAVSGGKKYICKISVVDQSPDFGADLANYNTRENYFRVRIKNYSNKPLTIYSYGAKSQDKDYKSYDRNLKLKNNRNVIIKPGKKKSVYFYVIGSPTWNDLSHHTIHFNFGFDGKKYQGIIDYYYYDSEYKDGSKWYYTYLKKHNNKVEKDFENYNW